MTPQRRQKAIDAAVTAIRKRHARDGDERTRQHDGARVGHWTMVSTCGSTAILTTTTSPTIERDDSRILSGTPRAAVTLPDVLPAIERCLPLSGVKKAMWLAADAGKVWTLAYDQDGDWAREWTPADCQPAGPVCFDARYLLEAFRLLSPDGEPVTWQASDTGHTKRPHAATLLVSADGQWAYLVMPMQHDIRRALELLPAAKPVSAAA